MDLHEIKIEIAPDAVEEVDMTLLELGCENWSVLEDVIARRAWIVGVFPRREEANARWAELRPLLAAGTLGAPETRALGAQDWRDSYKAHFKAWQFGRLHWVPVWERESFRLPEGNAVIWLDPGLAFGTGNHETTRLCVERLVRVAEKRGSAGRVIDAGCGSGILALSAARLGFADVSGFDNDPEAVRVSEENAALNQLEKKVRFSTADLVVGLQNREAEVVLANILADVLIRHASILIGAVAPGGSLAMSGILATEIEQVTKAFAAVAPDWSRDSCTLGEWSDLFLTRPVR